MKESVLQAETAPREEVISKLRRKRWCDVLVVGGGIHGACVARLAAFNNLSTVLLERNDYGQETSSRSSKMAHGGLRYLATADVRQVYEGLAARDEWYRVAGHLVTPTQFFAPVQRGAWRYRSMLRAGLTLYDFLTIPRRGWKGWHSHHWTLAAKVDPDLRNGLGSNLLGGFTYSDGVMQDGRLVLETILAARQEGALCLNYAEVLSVGARPQGGAVVGWTDRLTNQHYELSAGAVINCAGPWAPFVGRVNASAGTGLVRYSRGTHLLFSRPWPHPALLLPLPERGRYYFVWPHWAGTLVGTTEQEVPSPEFAPEPREAEVQELMSQLQRDIPGAHFTRDQIHYGYTGIRTIPVRQSSGTLSAGISALSRRHIWRRQGSILTLLGGKFTSAMWTAYEGLRMAYDGAQLKSRPYPLANRPLPGFAQYETRVQEFTKNAQARGVPDNLMRSAIRRWGGLTYLFENEEWFHPVAGRVLWGELMLSTSLFQGVTLHDLLRQRLELEMERDHGLSVLPEIEAYLLSQGAVQDLVRSAGQSYREEMARLDRSLTQPGGST